MYRTERGGLLPGATPSTDATEAYQHARTLYDFFLDTFDRDSWDGNGAPIFAVTDLSVEDPETGLCIEDAFRASWRGGANQFLFTSNMVTLDIFAHEYTHAVTRNNSGYSLSAGQHGALNESVADTFAHFIQPGDWTIGEGSAAGIIRDMSDPTVLGHPAELHDLKGSEREGDACLAGFNATCNPDGGCRDDNGECKSEGCIEYDCIAFRCRAVPSECNDQGFIHDNAGVPNLAAYLAIAGGSRRGITVEGFGEAKASRLYWGARNRMLAVDTFETASSGLIQTAREYAEREAYGITYRDCGSVINAWAAVGLGEGDQDNDCVPDDDDNCPVVYNPDQEEVEECRDCGQNVMCVGCTEADGCVWCGTASSGRCINEQQADSCGEQVLREYFACAPSCSDEGEPCSGSGPAFDDECCGDLICVVGACRQPEGGREQDSCDGDGETCALGLACRPVSRWEAPPTCCAEDTEYCAEKEDCCGLMDCVNNRCEGRESGEDCVNGDCIGASFCMTGKCT